MDNAWSPSFQIKITEEGQQTLSGRRCAWTCEMQSASKQDSYLWSHSAYLIPCKQRGSTDGHWSPKGVGVREEVCGVGMQVGSLWQWSTLLVLPCKPGVDMFRGEAETTRRVESCVPVNLHFPFPLPGSSVDLKVLMKTICLQKGFLPRVCYHKYSTETAQTSEAIFFPVQKIVLGPFIGWETYSACWVIWSHSTWPTNGPSQGSF